MQFSHKLHQEKREDTNNLSNEKGDNKNID